MNLSLRIPDELLRKLDAAASAAGLSRSAFVRQCLMDRFEVGRAELVGAERPTAWELGKDLFGCYSSESGDLSTRADEIVRERVHAKYAARRRE